MNIILALANLYVPGFVKKKYLQSLIEMTALSFDCAVPETQNLSYPECLALFARFSATETQRAIERGADMAKIKENLHAGALEMGQQLGKKFKIHTREQVLHLIELLYKFLGIEFSGSLQGDVEIRSCFFSHYYTDRICEVISSLDDGLVTGLLGRGGLSFKQKITAGHSCCRALIDFKGARV